MRLRTSASRSTVVSTCSSSAVTATFMNGSVEANRSTRIRRRPWMIRLTLLPLSLTTFRIFAAVPMRYIPAGSGSSSDGFLCETTAMSLLSPTTSSRRLSVFLRPTEISMIACGKSTLFRKGRTPSSGGTLMFSRDAMGPLAARRPAGRLDSKRPGGGRPPPGRNDVEARLYGASGRLDRHLLRLRGLRLRHGHLENPILVGGGDLRPIHVLREREAPRERPVDALPPVHVLGLFLALTRDRQNAVLDADVEL